MLHTSCDTVWLLGRAGKRQVACASFLLVGKSAPHGRSDRFRMVAHGACTLQQYDNR
jgi:hypothetical protein